MIEEFKNYVSQFDTNLDGIHRKYEHSLRVMDLSAKYAKKLGFTKTEIELATIIGLLHDIGRFEQYNRYQNFNDLETFDHADYGAKILFEDKMITKFTNRKNDYDLIQFAIINHNKLQLPEIANDYYLKFAKLIRDIDKLDIVYLLGYLGEYKKDICYEPISEKVYKDIIEQRTVNIRNIMNENDNIVKTFAFAFDINYDIVLNELMENFEYYYQRVNTNHIFDDIYIKIINYLEERIKK